MSVARLIAFAVGGAVVWMVGLSTVPHAVPLELGQVVVGATVTQPFGCTNVELEPLSARCRSRHFHSGIDLAAPTGTEVFSLTSGVASAGFDSGGAGNYVAIQYDRQTRILYCHLSTFRVRPGQRVDAGQVIGTVGATGLATGPHLHLEIDVAGQPVDPAAWLASNA